MELVKMSKKGQLVVPLSIRKTLGLEPKNRFLAYGKDDYVIFKKVELPTLKKEYEELLKTTSKIAGSRNVTTETVEEEISKHRKERKSQA